MTHVPARAESAAPETLIDTVACPECGQNAEVQWRTILESTDGPVEHVKTRCVAGHCFFLPVSYVSQ
jgi:hypothetical protein